MMISKEISASPNSAQWQSINWKAVESHVLKLKMRIAKATREGKYHFIICVAELSYIPTVCTIEPLDLLLPSILTASASLIPRLIHLFLYNATHQSLHTPLLQTLTQGLGLFIEFNTNRVAKRHSYSLIFLCQLMQLHINQDTYKYHVVIQQTYDN